MQSFNIASCRKGKNACRFSLDDYYVRPHLVNYSIQTFIGFRMRIVHSSKSHCIRTAQDAQIRIYFSFPASSAIYQDLPCRADQLMKKHCACPAHRYRSLQIRRKAPHFHRSPIARGREFKSSALPDANCIHEKMRLYSCSAAAGHSRRAACNTPP